MKHDIKFRLWDRREKIMRLPEQQLITWKSEDTDQDNEYDFHYLHYFLDGRGHLITVGDEHGICEDALWPDGSQHIIMQFTGLKDKRGKEVYDGDICSYREGGNGEWWESRGEVRWDSFAWVIGKDRYFLEPDLGKIADLEVIGNIYENPELLEAKCSTSS